MDMLRGTHPGTNLAALAPECLWMSSSPHAGATGLPTVPIGTTGSLVYAPDLI